MVTRDRGTPPRHLRRVRNRPTLRRRSRLRVLARLGLVIAGVAIGGLLAFFSYRFVTTTPRLAFDEIRVEGPRTLVEEIEARLEPDLGTNLLALDLERLRRRVEALPPVAEASIRRRLPGTLQVRVVARQPRARVETPGGSFVVDYDGVALGPVRPVDRNLPWIRVAGSSTFAAATVDGGPPDPARLVPALNVLRWLDRSASKRWQQGDHLQLDGRGIVLISGELEIVLGDDRGLADKMEGLRALLASESPDPPAAIDLRFDDMVVVEELSTAEPAGDAIPGDTR